MNKSKIIFKPLTWVTTLLLATLMTGCWLTGRGGTSALSPTATTAPTSPGAGTGLGGVGHGPTPVVLGGASNYVILAETTISTTGITAITGDIAVSPVASTYITGFSLALDVITKCFSTTTPATLVTGRVYAADYSTSNGCTTVPDTASLLTTAEINMLTAYIDAAGRTPDFTEVGAGNISGMTLPAGTYKWSTGVLMTSNVTLTGGPNDVWIFEIAQDLTVANGAMVVLAGALPKNIFWQVAGGTGVTIGTSAHMEGVIMAANAIALNTGATANSRLLAQTAVTLNANTVTQPAP